MDDLFLQKKITEEDEKELDNTIIQGDWEEWKIRIFPSFD